MYICTNTNTYYKKLIAAKNFSAFLSPLRNVTNLVPLALQILDKMQQTIDRLLWLGIGVVRFFSTPNNL